MLLPDSTGAYVTLALPQVPKKLVQDNHRGIIGKLYSWSTRVDLLTRFQSKWGP